LSNVIPYILMMGNTYPSSLKPEVMSNRVLV